MARQKSSVPTQKLIASVITIPIVTAITMLTSYEPSPEELGGGLTLIAAVVGYLVPPSARDQIEEVISDVRDAADE